MELRVGQAADKGRGNKVPEAELIPPERRRTGGLAPSGPPQRLRTGRPRNPGTQRPTRTNRWPTVFATSRVRIGQGRALGRGGHRCTEPRLPSKSGAIVVGGCLPFFEESLFPRGCPGRTMAISTRGGSAVPAEAVSPIVDTPLSCGWRGPSGRGQRTWRPFAGGARVSWPTVRSGSSVTPKVSEFFSGS